MAEAAERNLPPVWQGHWDRLPDYAALLTARHEAHGDTFRRMIAYLPMSAEDAVLDVAIGDGFFTDLLARRCPRGRVVGVDIEPEFLELAEDAYVDRRRAALIAGDTYALPFEDGSFDLVWCAHSLRSLPDAVAAVREWKRVLRPRGRLAILENDGLHGLVLSWSPEAGLAFYRAECHAAGEKATREPGGLHSGRRLIRVVQEAGLAAESRETYTRDIFPPVSDADRDYLAAHLDSMRETAWAHLSNAEQLQFGPLITPGSPDYLLDRPDLEATFIDTVLVAAKT